MGILGVVLEGPGLRGLIRFDLRIGESKDYAYSKREVSLILLLRHGLSVS